MNTPGKTGLVVFILRDCQYLKDRICLPCPCISLWLLCLKLICVYRRMVGAMDGEFGNLIEWPTRLMYFLYQLLEWTILHLMFHMRLCFKSSSVICYHVPVGGHWELRSTDIGGLCEKGSGWQGDNGIATVNKERQMLSSSALLVTDGVRPASMTLMPLVGSMSDGTLTTRLCNKVTRETV